MLIRQKEELVAQKMKINEQEKAVKEYELQLKKEQELEKRKSFFESWQIKSEERRLKTAIRNELVEEMRRDGLIEGYGIGYKLNFSEDQLLIDDVKQPNKVFKKYKRLFDEKSKGKFKISDLSINQNQNYTEKSEVGIFKIQHNQYLQQQKELEKRTKDLTLEVNELNLMVEKLEKSKGIELDEKKKKLELLVQKLKKLQDQQDKTGMELSKNVKQLKILEQKIDQLEKNKD